MKNLFLFTVVSVVLMLSSCSKGGHEEQCKKEKDKFMGLMLDSPMMKQMPKEAIEKMKAEFKSEESIKKCVAEFKQETMDCLMKASTMADMQKCK